MQQWHVKLSKVVSNACPRRETTSRRKSGGLNSTSTKWCFFFMRRDLSLALSSSGLCHGPISQYGLGHSDFASRLEPIDNPWDPLKIYDWPGPYP